MKFISATVDWETLAALLTVDAGDQVGSLEGGRPAPRQGIDIDVRDVLVLLLVALTFVYVGVVIYRHRRRQPATNSTPRAESRI